MFNESDNRLDNFRPCVKYNNSVLGSCRKQTLAVKSLYPGLQKHKSGRKCLATI